LNINAALNNSTNRFLLTFLGIFAFLYYCNIAFIGLVAPGGYFVPILAEYFNYIEGLRSFLLYSSESILNASGFETFKQGIWFRVVGHGGFNLAYDCLGYGVMSFFAAFVVAFPKSTKSKLWFLPAGLVLIQSLNILRFVLLGVFWKKSELRQMFDHHDIFNIVLYLALLSVMYLWINSGNKKLKARVLPDAAMAYAPEVNERNAA
jgi:exosortase/archaeosortase family protein